MKNILYIISCFVFVLTTNGQALKMENGYVLAYSKDTIIDIGFDSLNIKEYKDYVLLFIKKKDSLVLKSNKISFQELVCNSKVNVLFFEPSISFFKQKDNKSLLFDGIEDSIDHISIIPCYLVISTELYVTEYFDRYGLDSYSTFLNKEMFKKGNKKRGYIVEYIIW